MNGVEPVAVSMWASVADWFTPTVLFCVLNVMVGTIIITSRFKNKDKEHQQLQHGETDSPRLFRVHSLLERVRSINFSLYNEQHDSLETENRHTDPSEVQSPLARVPSLLERVRSLKLCLSRPEQHDLFPPETQNTHPPEVQTQLVRAPSLLERLCSMKFSLYQSEQSDSETYCPDVQHTDPVDKQAQKVQTGTQTQEPNEGLDHHEKRSNSDTTMETTEDNPAKMKMSRSERAVAEASEEDEVDRRRPATVRARKNSWSTGTASSGNDEEVDAKADDFINRFKQQLRLQRLDSLLRYREMLNRGAAK